MDALTPIRLKYLRRLVLAALLLLALWYLWSLHVTVTQNTENLAKQQLAWQVERDALNTRLLQQDATLKSLENTLANTYPHSELWPLVELEQLLGLVNQKLQIQGAVDASLSLLEAAHRQLSANRNPRLTPVKNALAQDLALLRVYRRRDTSDLFMQLDDLLKTVDELALKLEVSAPSNSSKEAATQKKNISRSTPSLLSDWWQEFRNLIRFSAVNSPAPLSPMESSILKTQLRLSLLTTRLALMMQQNDIAKAQLQYVSKALTQHADTTQYPVKNAQATIARLAGLIDKTHLPVLSNTLNAIQDLR